MDRDITLQDIKAAQRGLNMVSLPVADLRELAKMGESLDTFAARVISMGAKQIIAVKLRNGAE